MKEYTLQFFNSLVIPIKVKIICVRKPFRSRQKIIVSVYVVVFGCTIGVGRWGEGEKAFPLNKRRGSFERRSNEETIMDRNKKMKTKMKT